MVLSSADLRPLASLSRRVLSSTRGQVGAQGVRRPPERDLGTAQLQQQQGSSARHRKVRHGIVCRRHLEIDRKAREAKKAVAIGVGSVVFSGVKIVGSPHPIWEMLFQRKVSMRYCGARLLVNPLVCSY